MPKKKRREGPVFTVVALGDLHDSPDIPKDRFQWIGRYAAQVQPTHIVSIGDFITLDSLNTHQGNETFSGRAKGTFLNDLASAQEAMRILDWEITGLPAQRHLTMGNHERRLFSFEEEAPETYGMLRHELERLFESNGWTHTPYGKEYFIGGVSLVHVPLNRLGKSYGGKTAEIQVANDSNHDIVFGHSHVARIHSAPKIGGLHTRVINLGSSLPYGHIEKYAEHCATGWDWGVWTLTIYDGAIQGWSYVDMKTLEKKFK